jgi:uncharacterized protein YndB with AHSA1/START domain
MLNKNAAGPFFRARLTPRRSEPTTINQEELTMTGRTVVHATFTIERVYDASPARVFKAFSDPAAHSRWYVEGDGWPIAEYSHDFRVGGRESGRFSQDRKTIIVNETAYQDIVPDRRIIFAYTMAYGEARMSASLATVELIAEGNGTRLVFTEQGAFLDGRDQPAGREQGWRGLLDALGAELQRRAVKA